jgi:hypothetical protein
MLKTIFLAGLLASGFSFNLFSDSAKEAEQQPDILLIMPDPWRGDELSILGCLGVSTAQLDQLAHEFTVHSSAGPILVSTGGNQC